MRHTLLIILFSIIASNIWSQHIYERYTPTQGLVDVRVSKMVQDKFGRLIFLTWDGFSIYDGQRFQNYTSLDGKEIGIVSDCRFDLDSNLTLFRSQGGSIQIHKTKVIFDSTDFKEIGSIHLVKKITKNKFLLSNNEDFFIEENKKLKKLKNNNRKIQVDFKYLEAPIIIGHHIVFYVWKVVGKGADLLLYDLEKEMFVDKILIHHLQIYESDFQQHAFIRDDNGYHQLNEQKIAEGKLVLDVPWFANYVPKDFAALNMKFDNQNNVWFCNYKNGTIKIQRNGYIQHFENAGASQLLFSNLFTDRENNQWILSFGKEIMKIVQSNFEPLIDPQTNKQIKVLNIAYSISPDSIVFLSVDHSYVLSQQKLNRLPINPFTEYAFFWKGDYWKIVDNKMVVNTKRKQFPQVTIDSSKTAFVSSGKIKLDHFNNLLLPGNQLYIFRNDSLNLIDLPYFLDNVAIDEQNNYWCFSRGGFVTKINYNNGKIQKAFTKKIFDWGARCAIHWNKDTFAIGTRSLGLLFVKANQDTVIELARITRNNGISNNFVLNALKMDNQKIAIATASGVDIINLYKEDTIVQRLSLSVNNFEPFYQLITDKQNNIYALSELTGNAFVYSPHKFDSIHYQPNAFISKILVNGNPINENEKDFTYTKNNFVFEISAPSFLDNNNINFYFTLEGFANKWPINNNRGVFEINNLTPGDYQLLVKIIYPNKIYKDEFLQYSFHISPPFWKTWWFVLGCILFLGGIIFGITRFYFVQRLRANEAVLEKQKAIEAERNRIAADMHDDLGSGLTKITYLSQYVSTDKQQNDQLSKINQTSGELIENMGEIIWAMKPENNTLEELLIYIKTYTVDYCANNQLNCTIELPEKLYERIVPGENRRNIFLAIKEILHNIVKHAKAKNVSIKATFDATQWIVEIKDDGIGIDVSQAEKQRKGNGLRNLQKRLATVGGTIEMVQDNGTCVTLHIPL